MILYTTMPQEAIFPTNDAEYKQEYVELNGISMIVERTEDQYKIIRLLSTDPQHFLSEEYMPGQMVSLR